MTVWVFLIEGNNNMGLTCNSRPISTVWCLPTITEEAARVINNFIITLTLNTRFASWQGLRAILISSEINWHWKADVFAYKWSHTPTRPISRTHSLLSKKNASFIPTILLCTHSVRMSTSTMNSSSSSSWVISTCFSAASSPVCLFSAYKFIINTYL